MFQVSNPGRIAVVISTAVAVALLVTSPARGFIVGAPIEQTGTGFIEGAVAGTGADVNDLVSTQATAVTSSNAATSYAAVKFSSATTFDHITVDMYNGFVIKGFNVQVANNPNPNPALDTDWTTVSGGSFSGLTSSSGPGFNISLPETTGYGVRVVSTDKSNESGFMRTTELWVFKNYANVAPLATITAPSFGSGQFSFLTDETAQTQAFDTTSASTLNPQTVTLNWAKPELIGAIMVAGGSNNLGEYLGAYTLTVNGNPTPLTTVAGDTSVAGNTSVTGNTAMTNYFLLSTPVLASSLTLSVTAGGLSESGVRVGEIWAFEAPEPASMSLLVVGSLALLKRRR